MLAFIKIPSCLIKNQRYRFTLETAYLKAPNKKEGLKWALISAVMILAVSIMASVAGLAFFTAGLKFASGVGIGFGIIDLAAGIAYLGIAVYIGIIAKQAILNAHHFCGNSASAKQFFAEQLKSS